MGVWGLDIYDDERVKLRKHYKEFMLNLIEKFQKDGYKIYFLDGENFFNGFKINFTEFTVDGVHPTDFGNYLIAKAHFDAINAIL